MKNFQFHLNARQKSHELRTILNGVEHNSVRIGCDSPTEKHSESIRCVVVYSLCDGAQTKTLRYTCRAVQSVSYRCTHIQMSIQWLRPHDIVFLFFLRRKIFKYYNFTCVHFTIVYCVRACRFTAFLPCEVIKYILTLVESVHQSCNSSQVANAIAYIVHRVY